MAKGFLFGIVASIAAAIVGAYLFVKSGALPAGQDVKPGAHEKWAAKTSLRATMRREARELKSPLPPTDENLAAGVALYVAHCHVPAAILARRLGWSWLVALCAPFMMPVFIWALLNSTFATVRQGGIRWRDTFYSLEMLRAGGVK